MTVEEYATNGYEPAAQPETAQTTDTPESPAPTTPEQTMFLRDMFFYPAPMFVSLVTHGLQEPMYWPLRRL